jgi:putative NADH-flavin reductase
MRIANFGATGTIGRRITDETLRRDHRVTAISRRPVGSHWADGRVSQTRADVTDLAAWKGVALAHRDALDVFRTAGTGDLDWTYFSPAAVIQPGTRTGRYRTGGDQLLTDSAGNSFITAEDFAVAVLDELDRPAHVGHRLTVASQERDAA